VSAVTPKAPPGESPVDAAESLRAFRALIGSAPVPMWVYDRETLTFIEVNDVAVRLYGWSREEFLVKSIRDIRPPEDWPRLAALIEAPSTWKRVTDGWRHLTADGRLLDVEVHSHPIIWGDRPATFVMALDVSERTRTARALRDSEHLFRLLAEHATDLIALHDATGQLVYASPASRHLLKMEPEDLLERDLWHLVHPDDMPQVRAGFERLLAGALEPSVMFRVVRPDGSVVWLETSGQAIRTADPEDRARFITVTRDISARRRLEEQLLRSQKLEGIGRLAGGIAHDFNNLLTAILGHAELAAAGLPAGAAGREDLDEVRRAAERAAGLTRQLLAFARRQMIAPRQVHLGELVLGMGTMLRRLIGEHIDLATTVPAELWAVQADPTQLEQVILNLAVNARDAMPEGGRLTIAVRNSEVPLGDARLGGVGPAGDYLELLVTDSGVGMTAEMMRHIFEPFYTTKEVGKGTGLGLATCYGIIKQSGGFITVSSTQGGGSAFCVLLPRSLPMSTDEPEAPEPLLVARGGLVLLAEDDDQLRSLTVRTLTRFGYEVHAAADGQAALELADSLGRAIDLLVTDIVMPRMGGLLLADRLRAKQPGLPVLFVSGYASEWADGGHSLSESELLLKPWTTEELHRRVRERLASPA
jgi:two-component system, cell cycle sensor histidine kinase and response regulator CckA